MIKAGHLVVYWQFKGHSARTICEKLVARFNENAPADLSVTNWLKRLHLAENIFNSGIHPGKPSDSFIDVKILTDLTGFPFHRV
jgi:hypothetical protein